MYFFKLVRADYYMRSYAFYLLVARYLDIFHHCPYKLLLFFRCLLYDIKGAELFEQGNYTDALHYLKEAPATDETKELIAQADIAVEYLDLVDSFENAGNTVNTSDKYYELIERIQRYQEIVEEGKAISGKTLSDCASHMVETYFFYSKYEGIYNGKYSDIFVRLCFMSGNSKTGYFFLEVSKLRSGSDVEYMTNCSLESKHYRFTNISEIIYSVNNSEFIYSR